MPSPITVVPEISYNLTVEPESAVPMKVGAMTLVIRSVAEIPVSLLLENSSPPNRAGALGAAGDAVS